MPGLGAVARGHAAFRRQFPHVDEEALALFSETCGGQPEAEVVAALAEMQREALEAARRRGQGHLPTRECAMRYGCGPQAEGAGPELHFEGGGDPPRVGTVLLIQGLEACPGVAGEGCGERPLVAIAVPSGEVLSLEPQPGTTCFWTCEYGMHELRVQAPGGRLWHCQFKVTSHLGDFAEALDHFHDSCDWVWDGGWTDELEEATMELLAALDDHFTDLEAMLQRSPMGSTMLSEIGPNKRRLESSLAKALEGHDAQAVGRVYGAVRSLLSSQTLLDMFAPMLGGSLITTPLQDTALYRRVVGFERARFGAASAAKRAEVKANLSKLIATADAYVAELQGGGSSDFSDRWRRHLRDELVQMRDDPNAVIHPLPFQQLRGGGSGYISDMMKSMMESFGGNGGKVQRADTIEGVTSLSPQATFLEARAKVTRWAESLVDESISFGSPMAPFEVHGREPWVRTVMAAMQSLLSLGLGYVTQGADGADTSKLIALLDRVRASLPLDAEEEFLQERRRRERLKDVCRVVRAARKKGQRLSLSVNTDFKGALRALREHHSDNWVGPSLEAVWEQMVPQQRVFAFELWLSDGPEGGSGAAPHRPPKLIAADFGHPHTHGQAYYVATRFFDREFRNLQPGFILAFAEAACLKRAGFALWDLGGADKSPMMQYKPQVAIEMDRSDFLRRLRERASGAEGEVGVAGGDDARPPFHHAALSDPEAAPSPGGGRIPSGTVFADIQDEDLWGAVALRAKEEQERCRQEAALKAAKQQQRPPRTARKAGHPAAMPAPAAAAAVAAERPAPGARLPGPLQASAAADVATEAAKAIARQHFMAIYQQLLSEGVPQQDAAARALQVVASR